MDRSPPSHRSSRLRAPHPHPHAGVSVPLPTPAPSVGDAELPGGAWDVARPAIVLAPTPLLIEARFQGLPLVGRLLEPGRGPATFTVGADGGSDAPANPAYTGGARFILIEAGPAGWTVNLSAAMRAALWSAGQQLQLLPDLGVIDAPLALPEGAELRVACGEMTFHVRHVALPDRLPRPWLGAQWRRELGYGALAAAATIIALVALMAIPSDPKSLSFDDVGRDGRFAHLTLAPPVSPVDPAPAREPAGGGPAATGTPGPAGDRRAPRAPRRLAVRGPADNPNPRLTARQVADDVATRGILGLFKAPVGSALASVLADQPALGRDSATVLANLQAAEIGAAYGPGGLHDRGTGAGGADAGGRLIGTAHYGTLSFGPGGPGTGMARARAAGALGHRQTRGPDILVADATVRGALDKEIVRRTVRRHLNEVRYCYEQALPRRPGLAGRLVVQFAIAATGQVLSSVVGSSTLGDARTESCVTAAVRRWEFPQPSGGGLVIVSYPFQLQPAGG